MANFQAFRDCLSTPLIEKSSVEPTKKTRKSRGKAGRKNAIKPISVTTEESNDAEEELAEFIDVSFTLLHKYDTADNSVPRHRNLRQSSPHPSNSHILNMAQHASSTNTIYTPTITQDRLQHPRFPSRTRNRQPNILLLPPHQPNNRRVPPPNFNNVHLNHHHTASSPIPDPQSRHRMRDLRPPLDTADISSFDSESGACEGVEEGMAYGR